MLDSTLNATHLRNAFKCAAPHIGLNGTVTPHPLECPQHAAHYPVKTHTQKPHSSGHRPHSCAGWIVGTKACAAAV